MLKNLYIITGASSGLGASFVEELNSISNDLILIARNNFKLSSIKSNQESEDKSIDIYSIDLSKKESYEKLNEIFSNLKWSNYSKVVLINNASTILPISHLNETDNNQIYNLMHLNLISCILASQLFMNYCKTNNIQNSFIINISSGVSLKPIEGWGLYCISKAAVNMLASVIAEDSKRWQYPIQSISLNPGPMNTSMQKMIRGSEEKQNPIKSKFVKMHEDRELLDPKLIAKKIIGILSAKPFPNGEYINLLDN